MNSDALQESAREEEPSLTTELLLLPDGRVLVHNLTPAFAELLREFNPDDDQIAPRCTDRSSPERPCSS